MIILHVYCSKRPETQKETWEFVEGIRPRYNVVSRCCDGEKDYPNFLREYWGTDDMIILEQDKVPTLQDLEEIIACPQPACHFPYAVNFYEVTKMSLWKSQDPWGLGFVKFSRARQRAFPSSMWWVWLYGKNTYRSLDVAIEKSMAAKFGPMHLHERFVKHNHGTGTTEY